MVEFSMERDFPIPASDVWGMLANFSDISWIPGIEKVVLEGEGIGMVRHVTAVGLPELHERMDAIDHETMTLDYSVPEVAYLQVVDYTARAKVTPLVDGHCRVNWSCKSQANGISEDEATANTAAFYEMIMSWIKDYFSN